MKCVLYLGIMDIVRAAVNFRHFDSSVFKNLVSNVQHKKLKRKVFKRFTFLNYWPNPFQYTLLQIQYINALTKSNQFSIIIYQINVIMDC